ncbi:MAG: type II toxin-antitoxin system RelE/ParE family toxin [Nanoarchaeota archaeon]|nr:type II toxin-antitoxin system RelE/ParE family toxin [Nanoarchaeota archaeon]
MPRKADFSNVFLKNLNILEKEIKERVKIKIKQLLIDPSIGIPLKGDLKTLYKLRIGKFRLIYKFDLDKVYFVSLNLRKKVYKKK